MGCAASSAAGDGDMKGVGEYANLNPYVAKKQSAEFRIRIQQILDSVRLQHLGGGPVVLRGDSDGPSPPSSAGSRLRPSRSISAAGGPYSSAGGGGGGGGGHGSAAAGGFCGVVKAGEDDQGFPLEITQRDLRDIASVLRVFDTPVQNEIVGACLLARPRDVHFFKYDYSKSAVLTIRVGGPNAGTIVSAAVITLRVIDDCTRCLEVSWVATLRKHRKRGYAALLFGYVQQIAAVMGIEAVLVLSSRTSVGYWMCQPRAPGASRIIMVRASHSSKRLTKGYSKYPWKLKKLEQGLRRCEVHEEPPDCVQKFYSKDSPFRFNHAKSIHVWYKMSLSHVDYLSLSRTKVSDSCGSGLSSRRRKAKAKSKSKSSSLPSSSSSSSSSPSAGAGAASSKGSPRSSSILTAQERAHGGKPKRSKSWHAPESPTSSGSGAIRRAASMDRGKDSAYRVKNVAAAKLMARKIKLKAKHRASKYALKQKGSHRSPPPVRPETNSS